jgi:hypothetical protein
LLEVIVHDRAAGLRYSGRLYFEVIARLCLTLRV